MKFGIAVVLVVILGGFQAYAKTAEGEKKSKGWVPEILSGKGTAKGLYLPDYSYAGYHWGEKPLPELTSTLKAIDFGVVPDDGKDDTAALRKAFAAAHKIEGPVVLELPKGRLILRQIFYIERSNFVLKGAGGGPGGTVLSFPIPMGKMELPEQIKRTQKRNEAVGKGHFSAFSWTGGVLWTRMTSKTTTRILANAISGKRGAHRIKVDSVEALKVGAIVKIGWYLPKTPEVLFSHLCGGQKMKMGTWFTKRGEKVLVWQEVKIEQVAKGEIRIKEPLLHDLRPEWKQTIGSIEYLQEVGIEHLRIEFPKTKYLGHHLEAGYNGLYLTRLLNSWVRDVEVVNPDSGLLSASCKNITLEDIRISGRAGHYSVHFGSVSYALCRNFKFTNGALHNPSVNTFCRASVYSKGVIRGAHFDQHCGLNHQNLFDCIEVQTNAPQDLFKSGGDRKMLGPTGAFNTFWNIVLKARGRPIQGPKDAPFARLIGLRATGGSISLRYGPKKYEEGTNRNGITVPSLYDYQLRKRLKRNK